MPGIAFKRSAEDAGAGGLLAKKQTPAEKHDSAFLSPLNIFQPSPHNDTFVEHRITKVRATPSDNPLAQTYTFVYNGQQFGLIKTNEAALEADLKFVDTANANADLPDGYNVGIIPFPLRTMWKSKEVLINDQMVNNLTNNDHLIAWIRHLTTEVNTDFHQSNDITIGEHDTPGHFDDNHFIGTTNPFTTDDNGVAGFVCRNFGLRNRSRPFTNGATVRVIDTLDTVLFNENGSDKYVPTDFGLRVVLHRNPTNKYIRGAPLAVAAANAATAGVNSVDVSITNFTLNLPMFRPKDQLGEAINRTMVQQETECTFYNTHYRLVATPVTAGAQNISFQDIFNGARPMRVYVGLVEQTRWNGGFGHINQADDVAALANYNNGIAALNALITDAHSTHHLKASLPNFQYVALRINESIVQPEYRHKKQAYLEFRRALNRNNREMPFTYSAYDTDYGWLLFDLSENKDSFNEVLPNSTSGNVSFEMNLNAALPARAHQLIIIGEFRNEVKVGYNTPARKIYDY